jgi:hypothetical protein
MPQCHLKRSSLLFSLMFQGTSSTKTRSTVSGTGKKPYTQKGLGRARHGDLRGPQVSDTGSASFSRLPFFLRVKYQMVVNRNFRVFLLRHKPVFSSLKKSPRRLINLHLEVRPLCTYLSAILLLLLREL